MSNYSKFPAVHELMSKIPYPGASWNEVITTYPTIQHLHWSLIFAILSALLQLFCYILSKLLAPHLIGYTSTSPLPKKLKIDKSYYIKLGEACNYTHTIDINKYNLSELSSLYCNNQLSAKEIQKYFQFCNKYHLKIHKNEKKIQECLFPVCTKSFTLSFGLYAFYDKQWLYNGKLFYAGWPNNQSLDCCIPDIKLLYIIHIGWYIYKLFGTTFLDRHLKDFIASLIHHITAIILMSLSYHSGLVRVGVAVLLMHDPSDIILQGSKLFRLIDQTLLMNIGFACLVLTWFITRIVMFPYQCIYFAIIDYLENDRDKVFFSCIVLMCTLYVLHIHWFGLIMKAVIRALSGKIATDPRSDVESCESPDENEKNG
eukprot:412286_1